MDPLPPIPTPPAQRWREFRIQVLPLIVFACVLVAVVFLWKNFIQPVGIVGEVEAVKANVTSLQDGLLAKLNVDLFERVTNHQVIGMIIPMEADTLKATAAAARADLEVLRARMLIDERRREQDYQGLHLSVMEQRVDLAVDKANLIQASNTYIRTVTLSREKDPIVSLDEVDKAKALFESLQAGIVERTQLIQEMTARLETMQTAPTPTATDPIEVAINAKIEELKILGQPSMLRAPMSGMVSYIYRRTGEKIVQGEPLLTVSAANSERIVAYIRQPFGTVPTTNDTAQVRTRAQPPKIGDAKILQVGAQIQVIPPGLLSPDSTRIESGLPILVSLPSGMAGEVVPGEFVDVSIKFSKR